MDSLKRKFRNRERPLTYRLRDAVRYHRLPEGKTALVLKYPLRTVLIDDAWQPLMACLAQGDRVPLERLSAMLPHVPSQQVVLFLNTLTRKGYIDQDGYARIDVAQYPRVTVIVPVRNRPEEIRACLNALSRLDYPADKLEIIVVDDASEDATADEVNAFSGVRLLRMTRHRQASYCRNRAAELARGDILAFIDSDCLADPTWLKELVPAFGDPSLGALGGWVDAACDENGLDRYEKVKSALKMGSWFKRSAETERFFYVPTCNFLVRRHALERLGGFREDMYVGEDVDLCWRLQDAGYALEYRPMGRVRHKHRNRIGAFCARRFDYGTSEPVLQRLHTGRVKTLFLPLNEMFFWLAVIVAMVLGSAIPLSAAAVLVLADGAKKHARLKSRHLPIAKHSVYTAIMREYLSFVYHCCSFFSRYYLIFTPLVLPISPVVSLTMVLMHLTAGSVEYMVRRPNLNLLTFWAYYTLEQASYQTGVWWECIRVANFRPVLPKIVHKQV